MDSIHDSFQRSEEITGCLLKLLLYLIVGGLLVIFGLGLVAGLFIANGW